MTNRKIKNFKFEHDLICKDLNKKEKDETWKQHLIKLGYGIKKLQSLADTLSARKYIGSELVDIDRIINRAEENQLKDPHGFFQTKCASYEAICSEISNNIIYKLQTEMMFNACVSAKWSCLFAALAAIAACIGIVLAWCLN